MLNSILKLTQSSFNQVFKKIYGITALLIFISYGCSGLKSSKTIRTVESQLEGSFYDQQFTGLLVVAPQKKDTLFAKNQDKYFTPASTVKIFTLYTGLRLLPERIPTLRYLEQGDTLFIEGTGDPSWLHPYFKDSTGVRFLNNYKKVALHLNNYEDEKYAPGWAWEDYAYYFSPERGPLPLYGNVATFYEEGALTVLPDLFLAAVKRKAKKANREPTENVFYIPKPLADTLQVPFIITPKNTKALLSKLYVGNLTLAQGFPKGEKKVLYGIATDSIYKRMLGESDNFLSEQLMVAASSVLSDTLSFEKSKAHILKNDLKDLLHHPRWVDGSGLSRYNLFTPTSMVQVLTKLLEEIPKNRLLHLFPSWDAGGTIKNGDNRNEPQFIYAKSGSFGNTYNLCGYLKTKKGKLLVFSFMNNHFRSSSKEVRQRMYRVLQQIKNAH